MTHRGRVSFARVLLLLDETLEPLELLPKLIPLFFYVVRVLVLRFLAKFFGLYPLILSFDLLFFLKPLFLD